MAWDRFHKTIGSSSQVRMIPGYYTETITLGNDADASTSNIPGPINSDATVLVIFEDTFTSSADTYVQIEHSIDNSTWIKQGIFESSTSIANSDISKDMSKVAAVDASAINEQQGLMMLYALDTHGVGRYTRFTVKANGQDESANHATFHIIPHF